MKTVQLFTKKLYDKGVRPTSMRDGTKLLSFHYIENDGGYVFFGVTENGRALQWEKTGHRNGTNNMRTDLIFYEPDPADIIFFVAIGPNGKPYATKTAAELQEIKMPLASVFQFELNTRTLDCTIGRAQIPK